MSSANAIWRTRFYVRVLTVEAHEHRSPAHTIVEAVGFRIGESRDIVVISSCPLPALPCGTPFLMLQG